MNAVTTECPACQAPVEIDLEELSEGDCVVCDQCDEALNVVTIEPLVLEIEEDEDDDDELDDDEDLEEDDDFDEDDDEDE